VRTRNGRVWTATERQTGPKRLALLGMHTFTKADRLLKRCEFKEISLNGRKVGNRFFLGIYRNGRQGRTRLGITVSKRVGNAVARNRIKRLIREFFRIHRHCLRGPWDITIIARPNAAALPSKAIFQALRQLFDQISPPV
jgi:ribonuclease P protein component